MVGECSLFPLQHCVQSVCRPVWSTGVKLSLWFPWLNQCATADMSGRFRRILLPFSVNSRRARSVPSPSTIMTHCVSFTLCARQLRPSLTEGMKQYFETHALPLCAFITLSKRPPYFCVNCWTWHFTAVSPFVVQRGCSSQKGEKGVFYFIAASLN